MMMQKLSRLHFLKVSKSLAGGCLEKSCRPRFRTDESNQHLPYLSVVISYPIQRFNHLINGKYHFKYRTWSTDHKSTLLFQIALIKFVTGQLHPPILNRTNRLLIGCGSFFDLLPQAISEHFYRPKVVSENWAIRSVLLTFLCLILGWQMNVFFLLITAYSRYLSCQQLTSLMAIALPTL